MSNQNHRSLERALDILETLSQTQSGMNLSEICGRLDMPKSSAFSLLHTLTNRKYLSHNPSDGKYTLGLSAFTLGSSYIANTDFYAVVKGVIADICRRCDETVHLAVLDGSDVVYMMKEESTQAVRMASSVGKRLPAHATAIGKALLSGLRDDEIAGLYSEKRLVPLTANTITNLDTLMKQIYDVRKLGVAYEKEESTGNVTCVAAPVRDDTGRVCAAVSIAVPVFRATDERMKLFAADVAEGAAKIEGIIQKAGIRILF